MKRALFRHIRWVFRLLTEENGHPILYTAECKVCGEGPAVELADPFAVQDWTMKHAGKADEQGRHHTSFQMLQLASATVTPHPEDLAMVGPEWMLAVAE